MSIFEWDSGHAIGVPEVDGEHQALFSLCDALHRAAAAGAPPAQVQSILEELVAHTVEHLAHEEREMRATRYSLYDWHHQQHETARSRVTRLERRIRGGDPDAVPELLDFLAHWLNDHIRLADRMLGAYLRNYQRALAAHSSQRAAATQLPK